VTEVLNLNPGEVHLWWVRLDDPAPPRAALMELLSTDEASRAAGFAVERDQARFVAARAALRMLLGEYARVDPRALRFSYSPHGKPLLASGGGVSTICFNVSHSGELTLIGVALDRAVGVDVERVRNDVDIDVIARRFFSRAEVAALEALAPAARRDAFFACWVRKEAYLKARGDGLSRPLAAFSVSVEPDAPVVRLWDGTREAPSGWSLRPVDAGAGYAAALAIEGHDLVMSVGKWQFAVQRGRG
jgi:4'-phosphopantetheinyl transferase